MRVRYEMYKNGYGTGFQSKCDLSEKQARKLFEQLKEDATCGWAEIIGEDEDNYMEVLEEFEKINLARTISKFINQAK